MALADPSFDRPAMVAFARQVLTDHGLGLEDAEDVVQDAYAAWCSSAAVADPVGWMRGCIRNLGRVMARRAYGLRPADPLEQPHLSLSEPWARGGS